MNVTVRLTGNRGEKEVDRRGWKSPASKRFRTKSIKTRTRIASNKGNLLSVYCANSGLIYFFHMMSLIHSTLPS